MCEEKERPTAKAKDKRRIFTIVDDNIDTTKMLDTVFDDVTTVGNAIVVGCTLTT
jgi:hypothetical protein